MPAQALERGDRRAVVGAEALGPGQGGGARQLAEQLAIARAPDVDLVEERRDRVVVVTQQAQPLERIRVLVVVGIRSPILRWSPVTA